MNFKMKKCRTVAWNTMKVVFTCLHPCVRICTLEPWPNIQPVIYASRQRTWNPVLHVAAFRETGMLYNSSLWVYLAVHSRLYIDFISQKEHSQNCLAVKATYISDVHVSKKRRIIFQGHSWGANWFLATVQSVPISADRTRQKNRFKACWHHAKWRHVIKI